MVVLFTLNILSKLGHKLGARHYRGSMVVLFTLNLLLKLGINWELVITVDLW